MKRASKKFLIPALVMAFAMALSACSKDDDPVADPDDNNGTEVETEKEKQSEDTVSKYLVAKMTITTDGGAAITGREKADYRACNITIESDNEQWYYSGSGKIRGRGNSSWLWYDKKPYRIKLDEKSKILGLKSNKDWVLLANYRDATDLMNTFVFELGKLAGLPYTNDTRYVEVTLNGDYIGLYQLTQTIEAAKDRVDIDKDNGIILSLDADDGPELSPDAADNFWSNYDMPCCVKNPEKPTAAQLENVKQEFAKLEAAIYNDDYEELNQLMEVDQFIDYLLIQEFVYNVEVAAPRSIYLFKDVGKKWGFGPLWDFDAGYDFDWGTMTTGHNFFKSYKELVLGTDPKYHVDGYSYVSGFFTDMFFDEEFILDVQDRWDILKTKIPEAWQNTLKYNIADALNRDLDRWPIDKTPSVETKSMETWINNRINYMSQVVAGYTSN